MMHLSARQPFNCFPVARIRRAKTGVTLSSKYIQPVMKRRVVVAIAFATVHVEVGVGRMVAGPSGVGMATVLVFVHRMEVVDLNQNRHSGVVAPVHYDIAI